MTKRLGLVTGASSGLGTHFAQLLAKDGHDVVLVARREDKLKALAEELKAAHKIQAHVIKSNFTDPSAPAALVRELEQRQLQIDFLFNNAGFGSTGPFLDLPLQGEADMVEVNIQAVLKLTHLLGQGMKARKFGRVLNVASTAAFQPGPYMATYYATKAFVISWSQALAYELSDSGVTVTCHCPGPTETGFAVRAGNEKTKLFQRRGAIASAEETALHAYRATMAGKQLAVHGLVNWMAAMAARTMPAMGRSIAASLNRS
jgi:short-subunit dehydrogenase